MTAKQMKERLEGLSGTKALEGFSNIEKRETRLQVWGRTLSELGEMKDSDRLTKKQVDEINAVFGMEESEEVPQESAESK